MQLRQPSHKTINDKDIKLLMFANNLPNLAVVTEKEMNIWQQWEHWYSQRSSKGTNLGKLGPLIEGHATYKYWAYVYIILLILKKYRGHPFQGEQQISIEHHWPLIDFHCSTSYYGILMVIATLKCCSFSTKLPFLHRCNMSTWKSREVVMFHSLARTSLRPARCQVSDSPWCLLVYPGLDSEKCGSCNGLKFCFLCLLMGRSVMIYKKKDVEVEVICLSQVEKGGLNTC